MSESDDTRSLRQQQRAVSLYGDRLGPGALAGQYVIETELSSGGWGTVYLARHRTLGRTAAVKVLHRELATLDRQHKRFVAEAKAVNKIGHPNIVDIFELGRLPDGRPFFVMELLEGCSVAEHLARWGRLPSEDVVAILRQVCDALSAAHAAQIIHRDLKASNVHVRRAEAGWAVKLLDFGIAKYLDPEFDASGLTTTSTRLGSPDSMAPEQVKGLGTDARTDVYAFGVLAYYMLTGTPPFQAPTALLLEQMHLDAVPRPPSERVPLPPGVDAMILRCMEKRPDDRYPTVAAAVAALDAGFATAIAPSATPAVALYVEARLPTDDATDTALDDMVTALERVQATLAQRGYMIALHSGNAVLAIKSYGSEPKATNHETVATARELGAGLATATDVQWLVVAHAGHAILAPAARRPVLGGPLTRLAEWPIRGCAPGVYATAALYDGPSDLPLLRLDA